MSEPCCPKGCKSREQMRAVHGTPEEFRVACEKAIVDFITPEEARTAVDRYARTYENAPEKAKEGWGFPLLCKRAHYFVDARSLCMRWMYTGTLDSQSVPMPTERGPDDCAICWKRLRQRLQ